MKLQKQIFILLSCALALAGTVMGFVACSSLPKKSPYSPLQAPFLTQEMAEARRAQLENVTYKLFLDVSQTEAAFLGTQLITFQLREPQDVWVDFQGGEITSAKVNNRPYQLARGPVFILVPKNSLVAGVNTLQLTFRHEYSHSGTGIHFFQDPEDHQNYLYTNFEPFDANRMAPLFDQPDIKAPLELTVKAPAKWVVVANTRETKVERNENIATWYFAPTPPLSTYLYAMVAGPFAKWESIYQNIPLRLFARQSMAKYVPYQEWFKVSQQGLSFYEKYFAVKYPFQKYDQLIVPEFNAGAMENAGAVTFSERYLRRGGYTRLDNVRLSSVVLHEMAHMWFGDLVTMKWWNDLWLNESFATYMSALAQSEATIYKEAWMHFHEEKLSAYRQDQMLTTHPISGVVKNSNEAFATFDDITYGKGASVMKELSFYLGADVFQKSLQEYFRRHAYQNTTLNDFIAAFEFTTKTNMKPWFQAWLETTGVDTVAQSFTCSGDKLQVQLKMSPNSRPHAIKVAAFKQTTQPQIIEELAFKTVGTREPETAAIEISLWGGGRESSRIHSLQKIDCPDFIYANHEDHGYFKLEIDPVSLRFLENHIQQLPTADLRLAVWADLWQMVRDQKFKIAKFSDMALQALETEKDLDVLAYLTEKTVGRRWGEYDSVYYFWPQNGPSEKLVFREVTKAYENLLFKLMQSSTGDRYKLLFEAYAVSVNSQEGADRLRGILGELKDPDLRWKALNTLCQQNDGEAEKFLTEELAKDASDLALKMLWLVGRRFPTPKQNKKFISQVTGPKIAYSADEVDRISSQLFPAKQREMIANYRDEITRALKTVWPKWEESYQSNLTAGLAITYCNAEANHELESLLKSDKDLPVSMKKPLLDAFDDDRRCIAIRDYNRRSGARK